MLLIFEYILFLYLFIYKYLFKYKILNLEKNYNKIHGDWGLGIGDWGLGIGPNRSEERRVGKEC